MFVLLNVSNSLLAMGMIWPWANGSQFWMFQCKEDYQFHLNQIVIKYLSCRMDSMFHLI